MLTVNRFVEYPGYDVDKANQILDEAGYGRGSDGYRFELTCRCFTTSIFGTSTTRAQAAAILARFCEANKK